MKHRKTNRAKRVNPSCRNHGPCPTCRGNRLRQARREAQRVQDQLREVQG